MGSWDSSGGQLRTGSIAEATGFPPVCGPPERRALRLILSSCSRSRHTCGEAGALGADGQLHA